VTPFSDLKLCNSQAHPIVLAGNRWHNYRFLGIGKGGVFNIIESLQLTAEAVQTNATKYFFYADQCLMICLALGYA